MFTYDKLWQTMKERGISQYKLEKDYNISRGTISTLRKNGNVTVYTLDTLCQILHCRVEDILEIIPDEDSPETK
ncbi:MAG: helix-turn-helix transcriptional regulator [Clostridia bacterium]|nr:helix-turn-helix transcriptional regulator [Clostridia bacterium]